MGLLGGVPLRFGALDLEAGGFMPILWVGIDFLEFRAKFAVSWAREGPLFRSF